jgi:hypothetical protein
MAKRIWKEAKRKDAVIVVLNAGIYPVEFMSSSFDLEIDLIFPGYMIKTAAAIKPKRNAEVKKLSGAVM